MLKTLTVLALMISSILAEVINEFPSQSLLNSKIKIIDIRTQGEWIETGLLKGAVPITFFDERGNYNIPVFMQKLQAEIKPGEKFAIICHVGSRTGMLATFLAKEYNMRVINLKGGMDYAKAKGLPILPYKKNR